MASDSEKKQKLIGLLNKKAFDPVLNATESRYENDNQKKKLQDVKASTESEKKRFSQYKSSSEVKEQFLSDLNSSAAKKIDRELSQLNLPKLPDLKDEFLELCEKLEVD